MLAINKFADWTEEEIAHINGYKPDENRVKNYGDFDASNAAPIDWRNYGAVTPVKD